MICRLILLAAPLILLAACGGGEETPAPPDDDPLMTGALGDQIMVDPDLVGHNRANNAAVLPDGDGSIPVEDMSPDAIAAARAEALTLIGGNGRMKKAPAAREIAGELPPDSTLTAAARAAASPGNGQNCADLVTYTASWAARLPPTFPAYPRSAVQEAAGSDEGRCALRVVNFITPVQLADVIDFYYTRASAAGYSVQHVVTAGENVLGGSKGAASFMVYARRLPTGATSVDLVTNGN